MSGDTNAGPGAGLVRASVVAPPSAPRVAHTAAAVRRTRITRGRVDRVLLAGLAGVSAFLYALDDWRRYSSYRSAGYDVGIFDQAIRHYAAFEAPVSSLKGVGFSLLGDHFSPILAVLAPAFWIWPDTRMLGLVLAVLVAVSVLPVHAFCERRLGAGLALLTSAAYVFWWPIQGLVGFDFHEIAFAVPLMAWLIDSLDRRRTGRVVAICLLLLLVREDMGFMLVMVALILAVRRDRELPLAGALGVAGVAAFALATKVVIPGFSPSGTWQYWAYPALGSDAQSAFVHIVLHPLETARLFVSVSAKRVVLVCLFLPPTLLSFLSPYALLAVPILVERLLASRPFLWSFSYQYNAILAPIIVLATVDTLARRTRDSSGGGRVTRMLVILLFSLTVAGGTAIAGNLYPLHDLFTGKLWASTPRTRAAAAVVARIPARACVEADDRLVPHLIGRDYIVPPNGTEDLANWLAVDVSQENTGGGGEMSPRRRLAAAREQGFTEVWRQGPMRLLHRALPVSARCAQTD